MNELAEIGRESWVCAQLDRHGALLGAYARVLAPSEPVSAESAVGMVFRELWDLEPPPLGRETLPWLLGALRRQLDVDELRADEAAWLLLHAGLASHGIAQATGAVRDQIRDLLPAGLPGALAETDAVLLAVALGDGTLAEARQVRAQFASQELCDERLSTVRREIESLRTDAQGLPPLLPKCAARIREDLVRAEADAVVCSDFEADWASFWFPVLTGICRVVRVLGVLIFPLYLASMTAQFSIHGFAALFDAMMPGAPLPRLTMVVLTFAHALRRCLWLYPAIVVGTLVFPSVVLWFRGTDPREERQALRHLFRTAASIPAVVGNILLILSGYACMVLAMFLPLVRVISYLGGGGGGGGGGDGGFLFFMVMALSCGGILCLVVAAFTGCVPEHRRTRSRGNGVAWIRGSTTRWSACE
ncbi:MAG: hypothetical protein KAI66_22360 [Lentisphaeria bacterium]|nr:hypothetical protein [Lentisphaeria bacterium]